MTRKQYTSVVQDSAGNVVSGAQVDVRDAGGNLVTLYAGETGAEEAYSGQNPFLAGDGDPDGAGEFSFWVDVPADLLITVGTAPTAYTGRAYLYDDRLDNFESRSDLVATISSDGLDWLPYGNITTAGGFSYLKMASGHISYGSDPIADLPGLVPYGDVYPDHFGENTTPGTTDMSAAVQAALDYLDEWVTSTGFTTSSGVDLRCTGREYFFGSGVKVPTTLDGVRIMGQGKGTFWTCSSAIAILQIGDDVLFTGGDVAGRQATYGTRVEHIIFKNASPTANAIAIKAGHNPETTIQNCQFLGFYIGIDGWQMQTTKISNCRFELLPARAAAGKAHIRMQGVYDSTPAYTPGGGCHITNCEIIGSSADPALMEAAILVHSCDGLYSTANHFQFNDTHIKVEPLNTLANNKITDLQFTGCYFDTPGLNGRCVSIEGTVSYGGAAGNGFYQNIWFTGCFFRGATTANYGIVVDVKDGGGFVDQHGAVTGVQINGGLFRQSRINAIAANGASTGRVNCDLAITGTEFWDGNFGGSALSTIRFAGRSISINGAIFREATNPVRYIVDATPSAAGGMPSVVISNCNYSLSNHTGIPFNVTRINTATVSISNNSGPRGYSERGVFTDLTSGYTAGIIWQHQFAFNETAGILKLRVVGASSNAANEYIASERRATLRRTAAGAISVVSESEIFEETTMNTNFMPVAITILTGPAWASSTAYSVGDVVVSSAGSVYLIITAGTSTETEPTHTTGASASGPRYLYIGTEDVDMAVVVVSGESGGVFDWTAEVDFLIA